MLLLEVEVVLAEAEIEGEVDEVVYELAEVVVVVWLLEEADDTDEVDVGGGSDERDPVML